jgi:hypothetical protein
MKREEFIVLCTGLFRCLEGQAMTHPTIRADHPNGFRRGH